MEMHNQEALLPEFCVAHQNHFLPLIFFTYPLDFAEMEGLPVIWESELCFELHSLKSLTEGFAFFFFLVVMMTIMMMMMITKSLLMIKMPKMTMIMFESFVVVVFRL